MTYNKEKAREWRAKHYNKNKEAILEKMKIYNVKNRDKIRNTKYLYNYGITLEQYEEIFTKQNGCCKICLLKKKLFIDHCHESKKIRGLLCNSCNIGLGQLKESIENLNRAIGYINEFRK